MKKYIVVIIFSLYILDSNAENISKRHTNSSYINLEMYAKVLERYDDSNIYLIQIDLLNKGNSTISFLETPFSYGYIFAFTSLGVILINENERLYFEGKIHTIPPIVGANRNEISILPHKTYTIKTYFYIHNKEKFLKTNKNLRLIFNFNDIDLQFMEDIKQIISKDSIYYKW